MWNPANEPQSLSLARITPSRWRPPIEITKSADYPIPFWKHQDTEYEAQKKVERRMAKHGDLADYIWPQKTPTQKPRRAYLNPALNVIEEPISHEAQEDDGNVPMNVDEPAPLPPRVSKLKGLKFSRIRNDITPGKMWDAPVHSPGLLHLTRWNWK